MKIKTIGVFFLLFILFSSVNINAQTGFNKVYVFDSLATSTMRHVIDNDTIVIFGRVSHEYYDLTDYLFMAKLDTFGNIIQMKTYHDSIFSYRISTYGDSFIRTSDGGYCGFISQQYTGTILFKVNHNLELEFLKQYGDLPNFYGPASLLEVENGYILSIIYRQPSGPVNIAILIRKVDTTGNIAWERSYTEPAIEDNIISGKTIRLENNKTIVLATKSHNQPGDPFAPNWAKPYIFCIDNQNGNISWEWVGDTLHPYSFHDMIPANGGWILAGMHVRDATEPDILEGTPVIVKMNNDFEYEWINHIHPENMNFHSLVRDIEKNSDGQCAAASDIYVAVNGENGVYGTTYSFLENGDSLWYRYDKPALENENLTTVSNLDAIHFLSSGSIVSSGHYYLSPYEYINIGTWIIMTDKNGCLQDSCPDKVFVDINAPTSEDDAINMYPNPATTYINIEYKEEYDLDIFDVVGRKIFNRNNCPASQTIDVEAWSSGEYMLKIKTDKKILIRKFIVN